jgi:hypothetical protein
MRSRKLTTDGDIDLSQGKSVYVENEDKVAQILRIRLHFYEGEWFLDTRLGIPYFSKVFIKQYSENEIAFIFKKCILDTEGVKSILDYQQTFSNRSFTIKFTVNTIFGPVTDSITGELA